MSDTPPFDSFLKWKLGIESPSLAYAAKTVTRNIILAVDVPYPLLKLWHDFIKTQKNDRNHTYGNGEPSCSTPSNLHMHESNMKLSYTYVDLFDYSVPGNAFVISSDEKIRLEVNESFRKICLYRCLSTVSHDSILRVLSLGFQVNELPPGNIE